VLHGKGLQFPAMTLELTSTVLNGKVAAPSVYQVPWYLPTVVNSKPSETGNTLSVAIGASTTACQGIYEGFQGATQRWCQCYYVVVSSWCQ
jgi:hypothetical protein